MHAHFVYEVPVRPVRAAILLGSPDAAACRASTGNLIFEKLTGSQNVAGCLAVTLQLVPCMMQCTLLETEAVMSLRRFWR